MAKEPAPKPMSEIMPLFNASLKNFQKEAMMLHQAVETALSLDQIKPGAKVLLKERAQAFEKAMIGE